MSPSTRLHYYWRVLRAYGRKDNSQLTFWHERPTVNETVDMSDPLSGYYMTFADKASYAGPFDADGVPLLDYHGVIGQQYNPIAIAQYGLAWFNKYVATGDPSALSVFIRQCDWLALHLEQNDHGLAVWMHHFDWEYCGILKGPWYSALAQGSGLSALVRAFALTGDERYRDAAVRAMQACLTPIADGGVQFVDSSGSLWLEEYIVNPPSHVLNGFMWTLWGIRDYSLVLHDERAERLFEVGTATVAASLGRFDTGYWSTYDLFRMHGMRLVASPFYHRLHIIQLSVMSKMTGNVVFGKTAEKWTKYEQDWFKRKRAYVDRAVFKVLYY
jgi:hypothetical protein